MAARAGRVAAIAAMAMAIAGCRGEVDALTADAHEASPRAALAVIESAALAPAWTVPYGGETWRRTPTRAAPGLDIDDAIERVSHAIRRPADGGAPRVTAATYVASFDGRGLRLAADDAHALRVETLRVALGGRDVYRGDGEVPWSMLGNTAQALLAADVGLVEHHHANADGVELTWIVHARPPRAADLVVDVATSGLTFAGASAHGLHYAGPDGLARVRIGAAELVDAAGRRWPIAAEPLEGGVRWRVDADILADASFPVALDPLIGPELGVGQPPSLGAGGDQDTPTVAASGTGYFVAWRDFRDGTTQDIYGTRVSAAGVVQDPAGIVLTTAHYAQVAPVAASNGTDFLVVWQDRRTGGSEVVKGRRVTAAGATPDPEFFISDGFSTQTAPAVASNGAGYLVVWQDTRNSVSFGTDIYAARVTAAGVVQEPAGIVVTGAVGHQTVPAVAARGTEYLVGWQDARNGNNDIYAARVDGTGFVLDPSGREIAALAASSQTVPAIGSNGTDYFVAWQDNRNGASADIYGTRVNATGGVVQQFGFALSTATGVQSEPVVDSNGTDYLVAWLDGRNGGSSDVYGTRVSATAVLQDPAGLALATGFALQVAPAVASMAADYLIVYQDDHTTGSYDISGVRVTAAGVVDANVVALSTGDRQLAPTVASNGAGYLVAWQDVRNGIDRDLYATRLTTTGAVQDPNGLVLSTAMWEQGAPTATSNGTDYLVAWEDYRNATSVDIYGTRVTAAGVVQDPNGLALSTAASAQVRPAAASNGTDYLVAWQDSRNGGTDIYGTRVSAAGVIQHPTGIALSFAAGNQRDPAVASNGADYLVVWDDGRAVSNDIYAARMNAVGAVLDLTGFAVSAPTTSQSAPAVGWNGIDYLVAWQDNRNNLGNDIYAARVTPAGAVVDANGIALRIAGGDQTSATVAAIGDDYLVAWETPGGWGQDISSTRLTAAGVVLDVNGLAITGADRHETRPRLVANPDAGQYVIVYQANSAARARLVIICGDSTLDPGESCDDGNATANDGCSPSCTLEPGFMCVGAPSVCTDVDECATGNGGCDPLTTCTNTGGGFTCGPCPAGYMGTGLTGCDDVNECAVGNGGCDVLTACLNTEGSFSCGPCPAGYTGDGATGCADVNECAVGNGGCDVLTACTNRAGSFSCGACPTGYTGTGSTGCADVNECTDGTADCDADAICSNTAGSFGCTCAPGFTGDGRTCVADEATGGGSGCQSSGGGARGALALALAFALLLAARRRPVTDAQGSRSRAR